MTLHQKWLKKVFRFHVLYDLLKRILLIFERRQVKICPKWAKPGLFCSFLFSSQCIDKYRTNLTVNDKNIVGVLGSRTRGSRMECAEESTELWWPPCPIFIRLTAFQFICAVKRVLLDNITAHIF